MKQTSQTNTQELQEYSRRIEHVFRRAVRAALLRHKQIGNPIVGLVDGAIVWVQPEDIQVGEEE